MRPTFLRRHLVRRFNSTWYGICGHCARSQPCASQQVAMVWLEEHVRSHVEG